MSASCTQSPYRIGFLSVLDCPPHGTVGGLLTVNHKSRPLEFHCTTPVAANKAQEILYGQSLQPYLFGEQIGGTLLRQTKQTLAVVFVDNPHVLAIRDVCEQPVLWVRAASPPKKQLRQAAQEAGNDSADNAPTSPVVRIQQDEFPGTQPASLEPVVDFRFLDHDMSVLRSHSEDQQRTQEAWPANALIDVDEAFRRIHNAVHEAQKSAA